jgi:hypothetical protein
MVAASRRVIIWRSGWLAAGGCGVVCVVCCFVLCVVVVCVVCGDKREKWKGSKSVTSQRATPPLTHIYGRYGTGG